MSEGNLVKIPKFLRRLFRETSDSTNQYIAWNEEGDRIRIVNKDIFIRHTLPTLSKTKEYSAFIRQLNIYGFVKVKSEKNDETEEYYNCFFKRDQPNLMSFMKRVSKTSKAETQLNWPTIENNISFLTNSNYRLSNEVAQLKERVDKQDRTINGLLDILGRVFRSGLQNMNFDQAYNKQALDKIFNYSLSNGGIDARGDRKHISLPTAKNILPQKEEDSKVSNDKTFPDMNDIFF